MPTKFRTRFRNLMPIAIVYTCLLPVAVVAEEINIVGTGDGMAILRGLGNSFNETHPDIVVKVPSSIGSSGGIKAVGTGKFRLGRVARIIKETESSYGLTYVPFAKQPVSFFVNESVKISGLTVEEILGIYSGRFKNWKDVGGKDEKIRVVRREEGDSSLAVLRNSIPGFADIELNPKSKPTLSTQENFAVVSTTRGSIGFGPYSGAVKTDLRILSVDERYPTNPDYPSVTVLALIFKEASKIGAVGDFIDFATSPKAAPAIRRFNGIPYR